MDLMVSNMVSFTIFQLHVRKAYGILYQGPPMMDDSKEEEPRSEKESEVIAETNEKLSLILDLGEGGGGEFG